VISFLFHPRLVLYACAAIFDVMFDVMGMLFLHSEFWGEIWLLNRDSKVGSSNI
jgi:hypothetical protein